MVLLIIKRTAELITKRGPHTRDTGKKFLITHSKSNLAGKKIPFYTTHVILSLSAFSKEILTEDTALCLKLCYNKTVHMWMLRTNLDVQVSSSTVHCLWSYFWVRYPRSLSELGVDGTSNLFVINIGLLNLFKQEKQVLKKWRIERDVNIFNTRKTIYGHYCILLGRRS